MTEPKKPVLRIVERRSAPRSVSQFDVHLYAVVRVKICRVDAADPAAAIRKVESAQNLNLHELFQRDVNRSIPGVGHLAHVEWAEEIAYVLVDEVGDTDYTKSKTYSWRLSDPNDPTSWNWLPDDPSGTP